MNNKFDEMAKGLAQSVTRRQPRMLSGFALKKLGIVVAGIALACFGLANMSLARQTYTTIDLPGAAATLPAGINLGGQIVGRMVDAAGTSHGFLLSGGTVTIIDYPGAVWADAVGINDSGQIVGAYSLTDKGGDKNVTGFLFSGGVFTSIAFPKAGHTQCRGINNAGDIAGYYSVNNADDFDVSRHGFLLHAGVYTSIDFPGASYTEAWRVNDHGQIVGRYIGSDGFFHIYLLTGGNFVSIDYPGAVQTAPGAFSHLGGLNNNGDITSDYCSSGKCSTSAPGEIHPFVLSGGIFTSFDALGWIAAVANGNNDAGVIVGPYVDSSLRTHGFLRTP